MTNDLKIRWFCSQVSMLKNHMYALAIGILKNEADAEDAIQNALLSAYVHLDDLRFLGSVKPWILKILARECYNVINRRQYHVDLNEIPQTAAPTEDLDTKNSLWAAVSRLQTSHREVIILYYYEDLSTKEIARILNISQESVRQRLSRARAALRILLDKEDFL